MLKTLHVLALFAGLWQLTAADPPVPEIRFPEQMVAPVPPAPNAPIKLVKGQFYAIQSSKPLLILQSGTGKVSVTQKSVTITLPIESVPGWAADMNDPDFVTLTGPYTYLVKPLVTGDVKLQIVPTLNTVDAKGKQVPLKEADIVYKLLAVDMLDGPRPPPGPTPPDPTPPDPPSPNKAAHVWMIVVEESSQRTPEITRVLGDAAYWQKQLNAGHGFRFYDKDSSEAVSLGYTKTANAVGLPCLIVIDKDSKKTIKSVKLPADTTGIDAVLKEVVK